MFFLFQGGISRFHVKLWGWLLHTKTCQLWNSFPWNSLEPGVHRFPVTWWLNTWENWYGDWSGMVILVRFKIKKKIILGRDSGPGWVILQNGPSNHPGILGRQIKQIIGPWIYFGGDYVTEIHHRWNLQTRYNPLQILPDLYVAEQKFSKLFLQGSLYCQPKQALLYYIYF